MKQISLLVGVFIWFLCTANNCDREDCHKAINFVNNSSKEVYIHGGFYPDTSFRYMFPNPNRNPDFYRVKPGESNNNAAGVRHRGCLEATVAGGWECFYVFDAEVLATVPWDTIGKYYMVLKTYHPTLEELDSNNWTIIYTGE